MYDRKLLKFCKHVSHLILYAFCPLVIVEYSGNMHGEVMMIFSVAVGLVVQDRKIHTVCVGVCRGAVH